jgi:hypothetical protein
MTTIKANVWQTASGGTIESIIQTKTTLFTDIFTSSASTSRSVITNFFVDITPMYSTSKILVMASLAVGFDDSPEWSWFVDRTVGGTTTAIGNVANVGNRMNGYHGGPRDYNANAWTNELESFNHTILDSPATTSSCRYQVCIQDLWSPNNKYINRSGYDGNVGYVTRGTSSITVMEISQ